MYQLNNYKIELKLDIELNYNSLYLISQDELKILKKYLDDNLVKRFIRSNSFLVILLILFIKKLNKNLRLYVDYRALNAIMIKN